MEPWPVLAAALSSAGIAAAAVVIRTRGVRPRWRSVEERAIQVRDGVWLPRIRRALREGRFALVYQPIMELGGAIVGHEVLTRMIGEGGELIDAGSFIPTAERHRLIGAIDRWVVESAVDRIEEDGRAGVRRSYSVNLSGISLHDQATVGAVIRLLDRAGNAASLITFEVTETAAIGNLVQARRMIEAVRAKGCRFALDDFGKGLSSLAYLRHLPVDLVKIDGAFVHRLGSDRVNQALVRAVNDLAHSLGLRTVAECVEDRASLDMLATIGVDLVQGFAIGRPHPNPAQRPEAHVAVLPREPETVEVQLPGRTPLDLLEFVTFTDELDLQADVLREMGLLPRERHRSPDEVDSISTEVIEAIRAQAEHALAAGERGARFRLPITPRLLRLVEWAEPRIDALVGLSATGGVRPEWARQLTIVGEILDEVYRALSASGLTRLRV